MKVKTSELRGQVLDWAVKTVENRRKYNIGLIALIDHGKWLEHDACRYSTEWALGGPLIEVAGGLRILRYEVPTGTFTVRHEWGVQAANGPSLCRAEFRDASLLVAAMRCYVAIYLGDEIEVPKELL